jgi:hypothetical protein
MALTASPSSVLTDGLGSWSDVNLLVTMGLGVGVVTGDTEFALTCYARVNPVLTVSALFYDEFTAEVLVVPLLTAESRVG